MGLSNPNNTYSHFKTIRTDSDKQQILQFAGRGRTICVSVSYHFALCQIDLHVVIHEAEQQQRSMTPLGHDTFFHESEL